jgi:hypothetical protein
MNVCMRYRLQKLKTIIPFCKIVLYVKLWKN